MIPIGGTKLAELGAHKITIAATSEQPLNAQEKELVEEIYDRLTVFSDECYPYHQEAKVSREVIRLRDPYQDDAKAKQKTLQLHTLKSTFNNSVADQLENLPEAKLLPETQSMEDIAIELQDAVHYIVYTANNFEEVHRRRTEDFYCTGTAITQVAWDEEMENGKGNIAIIRWPIENFLWDTKTEDIQESRALIKVSWHPLSWYTAHYPDKAKYVTSEDYEHQEIGVPESQKYKSGEDEPRSMLLEYWYRRYDSKKKKYSINVAYCAGGALLEHQENVYAHGMYPFVIDVHSTIEGQPVGDGLVSELTPMMRYINRYMRYIDVNLAMSSKARMLVRRNSEIDKKALADWSTDIIEGSSIEQGVDWGWLQHSPFPTMVSNQLFQLESEMKQDSGVNQFNRGETTGGIVSGKAIQSLIEAGGKIAGFRTDTLNLGFKKMIEQILWLMSEFYDTERIVMITGKDGKAKEVKMSSAKFFGMRTKGAVPPPRYAVTVEINRRNPAQIEAQNNTFINAYTMAAQAKQFFPLSSLFRLLNMEGKERILPVIEQNENYQAAMEQLSAQNQQLAMQLEQLQKENNNLKITTTQMTNALAEVGALQEDRVLKNNPEEPQEQSTNTTPSEDTIQSFIDAKRQEQTL